MKFDLRAAKILDFDTESRPLTYLGSDFTTSELTAIACSYGPHHMSCWLLGQDDPKTMLYAFTVMYNTADIVTGHYIRNHDLPRINAALSEYGLPGLQPKLTIDTKNDLKPIQGISKSQESLAEMLGIKAPKIGMSQGAWRSANRLERVELARERVVGDVRQHQALRLELTRRDWLNPPKMWNE
jgi:hypothetical protein